MRYDHAFYDTIMDLMKKMLADGNLKPLHQDVMQKLFDRSAGNLELSTLPIMGFAVADFLGQCLELQLGRTFAQPLTGVWEKMCVKEGVHAETTAAAMAAIEATKVRDTERRRVQPAVDLVASIERTERHLAEVTAAAEERKSANSAEANEVKETRESLANLEKQLKKQLADEPPPAEPEPAEVEPKTGLFGGMFKGKPEVEEDLVAPPPASPE